MDHGEQSKVILKVKVAMSTILTRMIMSEAVGKGVPIGIMLRGVILISTDGATRNGTEIMGAGVLIGIRATDRTGRAVQNGIKGTDGVASVTTDRAA